MSVDRAQSLLAELAKQDSAFGQWLSTGPDIDEQEHSEPKELTPPAAWDLLLGELGRLGSSNQEIACVRSAAHTALRLRQLQTRFTECLERQKLEAIYHFAYGLSHELNNPLANIASRAGLLLQSATHPDQIHLLNAIADSAMRGCEMLGDLMLTARPPSPKFEQVELQQLREVLIDRGNYWTTVRQVRFELNWEAIGTRYLDRSMLFEILWSVLRNAIEASSVGEIVCVEVTQRQDELRIQVDDDGPGLSSQALQHCFDPYFSGREAGRGLGLGLTKAKRLVQLHGGDVTIENRLGRGCRVVVRVATKTVESSAEELPDSHSSG